MFVLLMPCSNLLYYITLNGITVIEVLWAFFFKCKIISRGPFAKLCPILLIKNLMFQAVFG